MIMEYILPSFYSILNLNVTSYELDHSFKTLDHPIVDGFEGSYEATDFVGN